ncbi:MAG: hypothetical protein RL038_1096 [Actinomycetota bacterium]
MLRKATLGSSVFLSLLALSWPIWLPANLATSFNQGVTPVILMVLVPLGLVGTLQQLLATANNPRYFSILAALTALAMVVRVFGAGVAGIEPIWAVVIITAVALGSEAGFVVGVAAIALSAIATGGIGPWLPYQMAVAGAVGFFAGLLHKLQSPHRLVLILTGFILSLGFGWLMNLWFWPTAIGVSEVVAFDPGAAPSDRLQNWIRFNLLTSLGFDLPRAVLTSLILGLVGNRLISAIGRASRTGVRDTESVSDRP